MGRSLVSDLDADSVFMRVLEAARFTTGAQYAALGVLNRERTGLEHFYTLGIDEEARRTIGDLPRGHGVLGALIRDPRPLRLDEIGDHPLSYGFPFGHPEMHTFLGVPVLIGEQAWGNLYLTEKAGGFSEDDEEALTILADWAAIAIANARRHSATSGRREELEREVTAFRATSEIARALAGATDLERVAELIVKRARAVVDARAVALYTVDGERLQVAAVAGEIDRAAVSHPASRHDSIAAEVLAAGRPVYYEDLSRALRFHLRPWTDARSGHFLPLLSHGRPQGVLVALDVPAADAAGDRDTARILQAFADTAASAVANAVQAHAQALERSLQASERERRRWARELHDQTLQDIAAVRMMLGAARKRGDRDALIDAVATAMNELSQAADTLRSLLVDLRPAALDELGIEAALDALIERVRARSGLKIERRTDLRQASNDGDGRYETELEAAIYRVVQEGLSNAVKHAQAHTAAVEIIAQDESIAITISDDGVGYNPTEATGGFGLTGMRERVEALRGTLRIESAEGKGTTVHITLPARSTAATTAQSRAATG